MIPPRLGLWLLIGLVVTFATMPAALAQQRPRRVFTNEDISRTPPPPPAPAAPAAPAGTPGTPPAGTPSAAAAPAEPAGAPTEAADSGEQLPQGLALAEFLQGVLRRYMTEFSEKLDQEADSSRQERWRTMMNLTIQLMAQNQQYIAELQAQQPQQGEGESPSQPQSQPAP